VLIDFRYSALFEDTDAEGAGSSWASAFDSGLRMAADSLQQQQVESALGYSGGHVIVTAVSKQ
jgi:hypothetical protein